MKPHWTLTPGLPVEESSKEMASQLAELEEANRRLQHDLLWQQQVTSQLAQSVRALEIRNFEISARRDEALAELQEWSQNETVLRQKTRELVQSNYDLEQFASLAAHDLQEPLHSIQVFVDLVRVKHESSLNAQGHEYLDRVTKAASRMQQLIEGLLLYARLDTPDPVGTSLSLKQIVQEIISDLGARIDGQQATIHLEGLPPIHGDRLHVRQLLQNLIGNALKFHQQGVPPVLRISGMVIQDRRHAPSSKPRKLCQIEIHDQGIGIPEEQLNNIFRMFKRLHRKDEYEGTGIGLSVCQRIAEQCGGTISVRSTLGEGSTFTVTLPV